MKTPQENEYLAEYDELRKVLSVISNEQCPRAHRRLSRRLAEIESYLNQVTDPNYRTVMQLLAERIGQSAKSSA